MTAQYPMQAWYTEAGSVPREVTVLGPSRGWAWSDSDYLKLAPSRAGAGEKIVHRDHLFGTRELAIRAAENRLLIQQDDIDARQKKLNKRREKLRKAAAK